MHVSTADELSRIGQGSTTDDYFVTNWHFQTNNFIFVVLTGLLPYFAALTAEKILVSGYVILLPLSALYSLKPVGARALPAV